MREPVEFEIDGVTFEFRQMPLPEACKALELVSSLLEGSLNGGDVKARIAAALARVIGQLPAMINAFAPYCQVEGEGLAAGRRVKLAGAFQGDVFNGHLDRAILFVANCIAAEFADFLVEGLQRLSTGLLELVGKFPALQAQIPGSGDSP